MTLFAQWPSLTRKQFSEASEGDTGKLKAELFSAMFSVSVLFNNFMKNLFITKSRDDICDLFSGQATRPYNNMGIHSYYWKK